MCHLKIVMAQEIVAYRGMHDVHLEERTIELNVYVLLNEC